MIIQDSLICAQSKVLMNQFHENKITKRALFAHLSQFAQKKHICMHNGCETKRYKGNSSQAADTGLIQTVEFNSKYIVGKVESQGIQSQGLQFDCYSSV